MSCGDNSLRASSSLPWTPMNAASAGPANSTSEASMKRSSARYTWGNSTRKKRRTRHQTPAEPRSICACTQASRYCRRLDLALGERAEELLVVGGAAHAGHQQLHAVARADLRQHPPHRPDHAERLLIQQQFFATGAAAQHVDRREHALFGELAV